MITNNPISNQAGGTSSASADFLGPNPIRLSSILTPAATTFTVVGLVSVASTGTAASLFSDEIFAASWSTTSSTGNVAGVRGASAASQRIIPPAVGAGASAPYRYGKWEFRISSWGPRWDALSNTRAFAGLSTDIAALSNINPTGAVMERNSVGMALIDGSTSLHLILAGSNGTHGEDLTIDTGFVPSQNELLDIRIRCSPVDSGSDNFGSCLIEWDIVGTANGNLSGDTGWDVAMATFKDFKMSPRFFKSNNANAAIAAFAINGWTIALENGVGMEPSLV